MSEYPDIRDVGVGPDAISSGSCFGGFEILFPNPPAPSEASSTGTTLKQLSLEEARYLVSQYYHPHEMAKRTEPMDRSTCTVAAMSHWRCLELWVTGSGASSIRKYDHPL